MVAYFLVLHRQMTGWALAQDWRSLVESAPFVQDLAGLVVDSLAAVVRYKLVVQSLVFAALAVFLGYLVVLPTAALVLLLTLSELAPRLLIAVGQVHWLFVFSNRLIFFVPPLYRF